MRQKSGKPQKKKRYRQSSFCHPNYHLVERLSTRTSSGMPTGTRFNSRRRHFSQKTSGHFSRRYLKGVPKGGTQRGLFSLVVTRKRDQLRFGNYDMPQTSRRHSGKTKCLFLFMLMVLKMREKYLSFLFCLCRRL